MIVSRSMDIERIETNWNHPLGSSQFGSARLGLVRFVPECVSSGPSLAEWLAAKK